MEYDSVKIAHPVRLELDKIKIEMGLPSCGQTVTTLIQRYKTKHDIITEIKQDLAREASDINSNQIYRKIFEIFKQVNKSPSQVTLADLMDILSKN